MPSNVVFLILFVIFCGILVGCGVISKRWVRDSSDYILAGREISTFINMIGVCAIAVLFATRKYLFFGFDLADKNLFRGSSRVRVVNKLMGCQIPHDTDAETLEEVLRARCAAEDIEPKEGACVYFEDTGLRVAKMRDGKISRIEVIHAIH